MSIIIRLQNLPLSARSGDIRKFFGGLRIPDGGVHILGGDNGDAFIAFMSDEDARLAMRKDGGRIKDSRVKLYLSSRMEMQHEIEKVTKESFTAPFLEDPPTNTGNKTTTQTNKTRRRSPEKRRRSRSRSPVKHDDHNTDKLRSLNEYLRSVSPIMVNSSGSSPIRYRSRSPRRRSPHHEKSKAFVQPQRSTSPKAHNTTHSLHIDRDLSNFSWLSSESQFLSQSEHQAKLEKRIAEEIEKNSSLMKSLEGHESNPFGFEESFHEGSLPHSSYSNDMQFFNASKFQHNFSSKQENVAPDIMVRSNNRFFITLSGMDPSWGFREVQMIMKGFFAPQTNMRWETDDSGFKTGTAFIKISNKEDFEKILRRTSFHFNGHRVLVNECPSYIAENYFPTDMKNNYNPQNRNLCYILKGLPFSCKYDDIINFFHGYEIADVIVFYGDDGRATGTGFVSFTNWKDFVGAMSQNGKKIGHRYIEMLPATEKEMADAKKTQPGGNFVPYSKILSEKQFSSSRRPLCALLTGLPLNITTKKILAFFSESGLKPDAVHLTLSKKRLSDGRAFVEFTNFLDFDLALKFHGKRLDKKTVCVKQILYDEMVKILDSQKARHYFETSSATSTSATEPEKVPYLWVPPDDEQDEDIYDEKGKNDLNFNKFHKNSAHSNVMGNKALGSHFPLSSGLKKGFNPHNSNSKTVSGTLQHDMYPSSGLGGNNFNSKNTANFIPASEPFSSSKHFLDTTGRDSTKKYEENIKLSRLSPENEAALLDFLKRDIRISPGRSNRRSKSLERRDRILHEEMNFDEARRSYRDERSRSRENFRSRRERRFRLNDDESYDSGDRNPAELNPLHFDNDKGHEESCVVQLSNVDASIGTKDLVQFLRGFDFYDDTLIRRYTDGGTPTSDVRVTFTDAREAKRAVKILNGRALKENKVTMFVV